MSVSNRSPVYIAAPYRADSPAQRDRNVERAELLARLAIAEGLAPVIVHSSVVRGAFGDDNSPAERAAGLDVAASLVRTVAHRPDGRMWVLLDDTGAMTDGVRIEVSIWRGLGHLAARAIARRGTWDAWRHLCVAHGLSSEWARLARPVEVTP